MPRKRSIAFLSFSLSGILCKASTFFGLGRIPSRVTMYPKTSNSFRKICDFDGFSVMPAAMSLSNTRCSISQCPFTPKSGEASPVAMVKSSSQLFRHPLPSHNFCVSKASPFGPSTYPKL
eukprot:2501712-Pleurochrysis_carterae.AAC.1